MTKLYIIIFFFFQAEDGIRDHCVTGVQTCALPICACTAVGFATDSSGAQVTLVERWNGSNWRIQPSPNAANGTASTLYSVTCDDRSQCTAGGGYFSNAGVTQTLVERSN